MKNKTPIISVALVLILILGIVAFRNLNSAPVTLSNSLPMYGAKNYKQYVANRTSEMKVSDEAFISDSTKNQTKDDAIKGLVNQGWSAISKDDTDTAIMRFNQVWQLDQDNFNVNWGYGTILGVKGELQESADYFDKSLVGYSEAKAVMPNDYLSLWDDASLSFLNLSDAYMKTDSVKSKSYAKKALKLLTDSLLQIEKLPKNIIPQETFLLAVAFFNTGDYPKARAAYNEAVKAFPEIKKDSNAVLLESELKEKGV